MNLALNEEQSLLVEQIHAFARSQLTSQHPEHTPKEAEERFAALAEQGILGLCVPEDQNGLGLDATTLCRCLTAIAVVDASMATRAAVLNGFVAEAWIASSHPSKASALDALLSGQTTAFCAGDPRAEQSERYHRDTDLHCFQGTHSSFPMGVTPAALLVMGQGEDGLPHLFYFGHVDTDEHKAGLILAPTAGSLGLRDAGIADLKLEWQVPGGGMPLFAADVTATQCRQIWARGQVALAAVTVGVAKAALDHACSYAQDRKQFGKPLAAFQAIQWKIADMAMAIEGASLLVDKATSCWTAGDEENLASWADAARNAANKAAAEATQEAIQIHGGYGFTREFPVERLYRDAHALRCLYPSAAQSYEQLALSSLHHT